MWEFLGMLLLVRHTRFTTRGHTLFKGTLNVKCDESSTTKPLSSSVDPLAGALKKVWTLMRIPMSRLLRKMILLLPQRQSLLLLRMGCLRRYAYVRDHPKELIIGEITVGIRTRSTYNLMCNVAFISILEPSEC